MRRAPRHFSAVQLSTAKINYFTVICVAVTLLMQTGRAAASEVGQVFLPGFARSLAWSPDGSVLIAVRPTELRIYDGQTLSLRQTIRSLDSTAGYKVRLPPASAIFTRDGKLFATAAFDQGATLWDAATWKRTRQIKDSKGVTSIAFNSDGTLLVGAGPTAGLSIWEAATGATRWVAAAPSSGVAAIAVSPDDKWLAVGTTSGSDQLVEPQRPNDGCTVATAGRPSVVCHIFARWLDARLIRSMRGRPHLGHEWQPQNAGSCWLVQYR